MVKPKLFVGSSREALKIADSVHENMRHEAEVTVWNQGIFSLSQTSLESLLDQLDTMSYGVFILAPDDIINIRGEENLTTRDNVIFELGLYIGRLGRERAAIFIPEEIEGNLRLPTDLLGMTPGLYESRRSDNNFVSATAPACAAVRRKIQQIESRSANESAGRTEQFARRGNDSDSSKDLQELGEAQEGSDSVTRAQEATESWTTAYVSGDYEEAIKLLIQEIENSEGREKLNKELRLGSIRAEVDFEEGVKYLKQKTEEEPSYGLGYLILYRIYKGKNLLNYSFNTLDEGIENVTNSAPLLQEKALLLHEEGYADEAKSMLNKLIKEAFNSNQKSTSYKVLAELFVEEGEEEEARRIYEISLASDPNNEELLSGYAHLLQSLDGEERAFISVCWDLNRLYPNNPDYLILLGNAYYKFELKSLALECYQNSNSIFENEWPLSNIGNTYFNVSLYTQAISPLQKALELEPNSSYSHNRLSQALEGDKAERKKANEIVAEYKRAQARVLQNSSEEDYTDEG